MRMTSQTGSRGTVASNRGFTFFEVLVTVTIFSCGIVMIVKSLVSGLDYQRHLTNRLFALHYLEDQYADIQREYRLSGQVPFGYDGLVADVILDNRPMRFVLALDLDEELGFLPGFYHMTMRLSWQERGQERKVSRVAYLSRTY